MKRTILFFTILTLSSCSSVLLKMYGLKNPKHLDNLSISKIAYKYDIPEKNLFVLDSSYFSFLFSLDSIKYKKQIKNHSQPLQALYFDKSENFISFYINCYAGGFPNLKWNRNGILNSFVPKTQTPLDSVITFRQHLKYIKTLNNKSVSSDSLNSDYYVIVYWNRFMGRQSKRLIKYINRNLKLSDKSVQTSYVNTDNAYFDHAMKVK
ncbi:MAG: hypothetical protein WCP52_05495 [Bacteroidota bacterium]